MMTTPTGAMVSELAEEYMIGSSLCPKGTHMTINYSQNGISLHIEPLAIVQPICGVPQDGTAQTCVVFLIRNS